MILASSVKPLIIGMLLAMPAFAQPAATKQPANKAATGETLFAKAELAPGPNQKSTGTATFYKRGTDLKVIVSVKGATPGEHGLHIHEKGECTPPDFKSAGGHFNPRTQQHGAPNEKVSHLGDLGNITIKVDGTGTLEQDMTSRVYGKQNWNEFVGKAVVLHANKDDLKSQPAGDAGGRIACGVIQRAEMAQK